MIIRERPIYFKKLYLWTMRAPLLLGKIVYLAFLPVIVLMYVFIFRRHIKKWNGGICNKCGLGKWELSDYDSDRINKNIYSCKKCDSKLKTPIDFNEISESEAKMISRDNKLKSIGI